MKSRVYLTSGSSLALGVGDLGPVCGARILRILDRHGDLDDAAFLGSLLRDGSRRRGKPDHTVSHRRRGAEHASHRKKFAAIYAARLHAFRHLDDVIRNAIPITLVERHRKLPLLAFCRLSFRIRPTMSKKGRVGNPAAECATLIGKQFARMRQRWRKIAIARRIRAESFVKLNCDIRSGFDSARTASP